MWYVLFYFYLFHEYVSSTSLMCNVLTFFVLLPTSKSYFTLLHKTSAPFCYFSFTPSSLPFSAHPTQSHMMVVKDGSCMNLFVFFSSTWKYLKFASLCLLVMMTIVLPVDIFIILWKWRGVSESCCYSFLKLHWSILNPHFIWFIKHFLAGW